MDSHSLLSEKFGFVRPIESGRVATTSHRLGGQFDGGCFVLGRGFDAEIHIGDGVSPIGRVS
jgi:hypothetical protein